MRRPVERQVVVLLACCDRAAAATESLLQRSCAEQLRRAHSARRVSWTRRVY